MAATTVSFGGVSVNGPEGATDVMLLPQTVSDQSANHTRWTYQTTTSKVRQWTLRLAALTETQYRALEEFFTDTAKGPRNTFTYVHTDGHTYTARFVDTSLQWTRGGPNMYELTVRIELTEQVDGTTTTSTSTTAAP